MVYEEEPLEQDYETEGEEVVEEESEKEDEDEANPPIVQNLANYEYTLAIVKPHAFRFIDSIVKTIQQKGFTIIKSKTLKLSAEQAAEFFIKREKKDPVKVPRLICYMVSGFIHVMVLAKEKAIRRWQHLMGPVDPKKAKNDYPLSLRAKYGVNDLMNALYGSRNQDEAAKDIRFFFKDIIIEPTKDSKATNYSAGKICVPPIGSFLDHKIYLQKHVYPLLQQGLADLVRTKPLNPYQWFVNWLFENDPHAPKLNPCELQKIPD